MFQLTMSVIAIVVSVCGFYFTIQTKRTLSSSDYRLSQEVKSDTASLIATLRSVITKGSYAKLGKPADIDLEKKRIDEFLNSPTGLAYYSWAAVKSRNASKGAGEYWRTFFPHLSELTMSTDSHEIVWHASELEKMLVSLEKRDLETIINYNADLTKMIDSVGDSRDGNAFVLLAVEDNDVNDPNKTDKEKIRMLNFLKNEKDVRDPTLDLFLAVYQEDLKGVQEALDNGAEINMPLYQLLSKYEVILKELDQ